MNEPTVWQQMEDWGYYFLPKAHAGSPGYSGILVAIREEPTGMHFDPISMRLKLCENGEAKDQTVHLNPVLARLTPVSPGPVILQDRNHEEVEFFTFGGSLEVLSNPTETIFALRSAAPILFLTEPPAGVADQLAFEVEGLLATYTARWGLNQEGFIHCLAGLDAEQFYLACLVTLLARFEQYSDLRQVYRPLYYALQHEEQWYKKTNQWPAYLPGLDALLLPEECTNDDSTEPQKSLGTPIGAGSSSAAK